MRDARSQTSPLEKKKSKILKKMAWSSVICNTILYTTERAVPNGTTNRFTRKLPIRFNIATPRTYIYNILQLLNLDLTTTLFTV